MALAYKTKLGVLVHDDCFNTFETLIKEKVKVDLILADLPYGTTQNNWDSVLPLDLLWKNYWQLCKERTPVVLTAQYPFDKTLGASQIEYLKYEWIWKKNYATGHLNSKSMPMKNHENILVFYKKPPTYNPQFTEGEPYKSVVGADAKTSSNYGVQGAYVIDNPGIRYPRTVLDFDKARGSFHPTQKPLALFEYMIKTYTNPNDVVLDNVLGSGTTAVACERLGRKWIGIEKEAKYIEVIIKRLEAELTP